MIAMPFTVGRAASKPVPLAVIDSVLADTSSLTGNVVYVDFWASWCAPCRKSFPWMRDLQNRYGQEGLRVIAVDVDKDHSSAEEFLREMDPSFSILFDSTGSLAKLYDLKVMPTSFIYDRNGTIKERHEGFQLEDTPDIDAIVRELLANKVEE
jgi:cytochrome c biogenesis protein CcmG/thiol:disulfide interchange protein DsbE